MSPGAETLLFTWFWFWFWFLLVCDYEPRCRDPVAAEVLYVRGGRADHQVVEDLGAHASSARAQSQTCNQQSRQF